MPYVYLIHLAEPIGSDNPRGRASHYMGWVANNLAHRIWEHQHDRSQASGIIWEACQRGLAITLVRTWYVPWPKPWLLEHGLKANNRHSTFCPCCNERWNRHGIDYEAIMWRGVRRIQQWRPDFLVEPSIITSMARYTAHIEPRAALEGQELTWEEEDPFAGLVTPELNRAIDREIALQDLYRRRRLSAQPIPLPEYVHEEGEINF